MGKTISEQLDELIKAQGRTRKFVYNKLGMTSVTFARRLRRNDWRVSEVKVLSGIFGTEIAVNYDKQC